MYLSKRPLTPQNPARLVATSPEGSTAPGLGAASLYSPPALAAGSQLMGIPGGVAGTLATLKLMRLLVQKGKIEARPLALQLTADLQQKDFRGEIERLFEYVRDRIRYVKDINSTETIHDVPHILAQGAGDCDDKSILLASLLEAIGHPTRFVAIGERPGEYCHVFVETRFGNHWMPLETTEPVGAGWQYPIGRKNRMVWPPTIGG